MSCSQYVLASTSTSTYAYGRPQYYIGVFDCPMTAAMAAAQVFRLSLSSEYAPAPAGFTRLYREEGPFFAHYIHRHNTAFGIIVAHFLLLLAPLALYRAPIGPGCLSAPTSPTSWKWATWRSKSIFFPGGRRCPVNHTPITAIVPWLVLKPKPFCYFSTVRLYGFRRNIT